ncbi:MAG: hypothetical protein KKI16_11560 [Alphaproteobacteria bacterium]|jgi:hypothetical protein|uniref:Uncharacterized protein n=1 Tax=Loktanella salsilacus TaxID=195913 RepID=A0A1I4D199_9RHOB|nr:hypothetical protein [Loktanella salsilacus]MBU0780987.1 hypothetical protein [Alphaproteobacteria bacterium]MBU0862596.1 hypothetical protein [Alphaproteobacteria bacterium]SFK85871.1 hypothetical protein SAMN04488004_10376 [Loktanella salsilacus]
MLRLSVELARASDLAVQIEETMDHGQTRREHDLRNVQNLDLLAQTLADLGRFTQALAPMLTTLAVSPGTATGGMALRGVADRLAGAAVDLPEDAGGDVCVF